MQIRPFSIRSLKQASIVPVSQIALQRATMSTQRAIVHKSKGVAEVSSSVPLPKLRDDYILVKTKAVALNPTDWKAIENRPTPGAISGCDYSGIVQEVGKNVKTPFKPGDRVAGFVHGGTL